MPRPRFPHLRREAARGKTFWYVRRGHGLRIRIRGDYGSQEFFANYYAALGSSPSSSASTRIVYEHEDRLSSVYFIRCGNAVKIGISKDAHVRARAIQVAQSETVEVVHTCKGGRKLERYFHKLFASLRVRGEWFRYEGDLLDWLNAETACAA
jgi:hypothetical protein